MVWLLLVACKPSEPDDSTPPTQDTACVPGVEVPYDGLDQDCDGADLDDVDGDGFPFATDCDDANPAAHPGAEELPYDGLDQDCDGADLDDVDEDGFPVSVDCDDADPAAFPGAAETCDGVDQDCDGVADDDPGDALSGYLDADGDGFGDAASPWTGCEALGPEDGTDCDDTDPLVFPGASELCDDLVDNNCDGYLDQMVAGWTQSAVQEAIDAACADGDTVWVAPGTYYETVVIGRPITLEAIEDSTTTGIDASACSGDCPVVTVEADDVTVRGLALTGGMRATGDGGGLAATDVSGLRVDACLVTGNAARRGGGLALVNTSAHIENTELDSNVSPMSGYGGGIYLRSSGDMVVLDGLYLHDNEAGFGGGLMVWVGGTPVVLLDSVIEHNQASYGGGVFLDSGVDFFSSGNKISGNIGTGTNECVGGGVLSYAEWWSYADSITGNSPDDACP